MAEKKAVPGTHGRFDERALETSSWTWPRLRAGKQALLGTGVLGAAAVLGTMNSRTAH